MIAAFSNRPPCRNMSQIQATGAFSAERQHLTLRTDFPLTARERSFALRTFDGKVCPTPAIHRSPEKGRSGGEPTFPICPAWDAQAEKQTFTHWR